MCIWHWGIESLLTSSEMGWVNIRNCIQMAEVVWTCLKHGERQCLVQKCREIVVEGLG